MNYKIVLDKYIKLINETKSISKSEKADILKDVNFFKESVSEKVATSYARAIYRLIQYEEFQLIGNLIMEFHLIVARS